MLYKVQKDYFFLDLSGACVNNAPAKLFVSLDVFGFDNALDAFVAISGLVFSFFAIALLIKL